MLKSLTISGLECECTTYECLSEGRRTCTASHSCYSQLTKVVERGCIDRKTPLLCENQRPNKKTISKLMAGWPVLHCCRDRDFCNRGVIPTEPPDQKGTVWFIALYELLHRYIHQDNCTDVVNLIAQVS